MKMGIVVVMNTNDEREDDDSMYTSYALISYIKYIKHGVGIEEAQLSPTLPY